MSLESFVFYRSFYEAVKELPDEQRVKIYDAICEYGLNHKEIKLEGMSKAMFSLMKTSMDYSRNRRMANIENGKKGAEARWRKNGETMANEWQDDSEDMANCMANEMAKSYLNENEDEDVNEDVNVDEYEDRGSRGKRFVKPTADEVREYCESRNNSVDPEEFVDFYTSKGWKVGSQPMKDWKACVRTWERNYRNRPSVSKEPDTTVPIYDDSKNVCLSNDDLKDILKEMGRV